MRYLGIDYGSKRIGLALSDELGTMGFPHQIMRNTKSAATRIEELIKKERVSAIVMGESKNFKGEENPINKASRVFAGTLAHRTGLPIFYEPEVFTSAEARRIPATRGKRVDASAAALILSSFLSKAKIHDHA